MCNKLEFWFLKYLALTKENITFKIKSPNALGLILIANIISIKNIFFNPNDPHLVDSFLLLHT